LYRFVDSKEEDKIKVRCRIEYQPGKWKIDNRSSYMCDARELPTSCFFPASCESSFENPAISSRKKPASLDLHPEDNYEEQMNFKNMYITFLFVFQVLCGDSWSPTFQLILRSNYQNIVMSIIIYLPIVFSMIISGFIIASFCDIIARIKQVDVLPPSPRPRSNTNSVSSPSSINRSSPLSNRYAPITSDTQDRRRHLLLSLQNEACARVLVQVAFTGTH
jgi:hypothetical protein